MKIIYKGPIRNTHGIIHRTICYKREDGSYLYRNELLEPDVAEKIIQDSRNAAGQYRDDILYEKESATKEHLSGAYLEQAFDDYEFYSLVSGSERSSSIALAMILSRIRNKTIVTSHNQEIIIANNGEWIGNVDNDDKYAQLAYQYRHCVYGGQYTTDSRATEK